MNGGHVHTLENLWIRRITVRHLEPGIFASQNHFDLSKRLLSCCLLGMHKEIIKQKIVITITEIATEDVMNVRASEQDF